MQRDDAPDTARRWLSLWLAAFGLGGSATLGHAQGKDGPGAKDLFFGDDKPALVAERSLRPAVAPGQGGATSTTAAAKQPTNPGLRVWLTEASDSSGSRRLSPQQSFRTGDRFRLWLQSNRDGYLYLVNVGTSGTTRLMFPRNNQDNRITARTDFSIGSPLVFSEPAGTEQLVVVLAANPIEDAPVQLKDGSLMRVSLKGGASSPPRPAAKPAAKPPAQGGRDAVSSSLDLALADLRGAKDLKFDDDGTELVAVNRQTDVRPGAFSPVVVNLRLTHR